MSNTVTSIMDLFSTPLVSDKSSPFRALPDDTDEDPPTTGPLANEVMPPRRQLSNRSIHMMSKTDVAMQEIDKQLADILRRLKGTKDMMKFARDERTLVEVDYPIKSCEQTYSHMYRMSMLLKTMWMSWNVIRSQHSYTSDTRHMMRNLQPVALDIAGAFQRFVDLMCYMMREPAINLEGDIMKAVLDLIEACDVLHRRKSQIMLMLINQSVHDYVENLDPSDPFFRREEVAADQPLNPGPVVRPHSTINVPSHAAGAGGEADRAHHQHSGLDFQRPTTQSSHLSRSPCLPRSNTFDNGFNHFAPFTPVGSPSTQGFSFQVLASERNVSVTPFLPKSGQESTRMHACSPTGPVRLPSNFCFPVTSEDAEGMHSFTLSLEMFANEAKLLMMSIGAMLDNVRSKL